MRDLVQLVIPFKETIVNKFIYSVSFDCFYVKNSSGTVYSCIFLYNRTAGRGNPYDAIYTHHIKNRTFKVRYTTTFIL